MADALINGNNQPLATVLPAYPYLQYSDDDNISAFFTAYTQLSQSYLDWFNSTPLAVYAPANGVQPGVSGALLDWIGEGIYGIPRPVISTLTTRIIAGMNTVPMNSGPMNDLVKVQSGTATIATDDIYRRVMTWILYRGDGLQASIPWLRRRIARFLYGQDGADVSLNETLNVKIVRPNLPMVGAMASYPMNTQPMNTLLPSGQLSKRTLAISIPTSQIAQQFVSLLAEGYLPVPLQITLTVTLT